MTVRAWLVGVCLWAFSASAAGKPLSLVITGDNGGEVAPCGCKMNPTGGFAKRKTVLKQWASKPLLQVDAGNALFASAGSADDKQRARAAFILKTMGELGTAAMAVGPRDLAAGVSFLKASAKGGKLKLLSANLREGSEAPFEGSAMFTVQGVKVGVVGLIAAGPVVGAPTLTGAPVEEAAQRELGKLKGHVDVTVVLAAMPYADSLALANALSGRADFIIQSGDNRGQVAQAVAGAYLLGAGDRGRALGEMELKVSGKGPWVDLSAKERDAQLLTMLDDQLKQLQDRLKSATDASTKSALTQTSTEMKKRRDEQAKRVALAVAPSSRTMKLQWKALDSSVVDDEALKKEVLVHEPTYAGH